MYVLRLGLSVIVLGACFGVMVMTFVNDKFDNGNTEPQSICVACGDECDTPYCGQCGELIATSDVEDGE